ncbi:MAG: type II toxin-antitoxin system RelE/ParE family toxin [Flavobacteriales bacterium]|nr:MAG: type II toxin-antitoxin system RelE/ParE family toxin [Flavobacteriales bacterium]
MRLKVSEYAAARLDDIWDYYATEASERVADRITKKIVDDIDWLVDHPRGGQYEPLLDHLGLGHRRKVSGNYKIIYRIIGDLIFVSDIFDARQEPEKMVW